MGRHFPVREKSGNFEHTGKVRENCTKYWKTRGIWDKYYLIFLVIFKWTVYYLLKWVKCLVKKKQNIKKILENGKKYWKSQGILSVLKSGNPVSIHVGILSDGMQILPCTVCLMKVLVSCSFKWNANISICFMWYVQRYIVGSEELPLPCNV